MARREFLLGALGAGAAIGALPAILAGCGNSSSSSSAAGSQPTEGGGTLRFGSQYDLLKLDPAFIDTEQAVAWAIYEGLVTYKPSTFEVVNQLAEEFEPGKNGLQYRFKLKEGIPFHDGFGHVTAEDVKFSFERIAGLTKPKIDSAFVADWIPHLESVKVHGELEGTIVLNRQFAPLLTTTLPGLSGLVLSKRAVEQRGESYARQPVGTGPYHIASFTPKRELVLERFEDYGGASSAFLDPFFDEIVVSKNGDVNSVTVALSSGELDAADFFASELDRFSTDDSIETKKFTSLGYDWISMNVTDPSLAEIKVRQAIRLAIDVPGIVAGAYNGSSEQATAVIPPAMPIGFWDAAPRYPRNVEDAKALLREAAVGPLSLKLRAISDDPTAVKAAEIVQANLRDVGIDVALNLQDTGTFFATTGDALKNDQLTLVSFASFPDPFWSMEWFTCDQVGVFNMMSWCDEEFDRLLAESTKELDPQRRSAIYVRMQELWDASANAVWITWPAVAFALRSGVVGSFRPDGVAQLQAFSRT